MLGPIAERERSRAWPLQVGAAVVLAGVTAHSAGLFHHPLIADQEGRGVAWVLWIGKQLDEFAWAPAWVAFAAIGVVTVVARRRGSSEGVLGVLGRGGVLAVGLVETFGLLLAAVVGLLADPAAFAVLLAGVAALQRPGDGPAVSQRHDDAITVIGVTAALVGPLVLVSVDLGEASWLALTPSQCPPRAVPAIILGVAATTAGDFMLRSGRGAPRRVYGAAVVAALVFGVLQTRSFGPALGLASGGFGFCVLGVAWRGRVVGLPVLPNPTRAMARWSRELVLVGLIGSTVLTVEVGIGMRASPDLRAPGVRRVARTCASSAVTVLGDTAAVARQDAPFVVLYDLKEPRPRPVAVALPDVRDKVSDAVASGEYVLAPVLPDTEMALSSVIIAPVNGDPGRLADSIPCSLRGWGWDARRGRLWLTCSEGSRVLSLDPATGAVVDEGEIGHEGSNEDPEEQSNDANGLWLDAERDLLLSPVPGGLMEFALEGLEARWTLELGVATADVAFHGARRYLTHTGGSSVWVVDRGRLEVERVIRVGLGAGKLRVLPKSGLLAVAGLLRPELTFISLADGHVVGRLRLGSQVNGLALGPGGSLLATTSCGLFEVHPDVAFPNR
jgi:hypothetical protein